MNPPVTTTGRERRRLLANIGPTDWGRREGATALPRLCGRAVARRCLFPVERDVFGALDATANRNRPGPYNGGFALGNGRQYRQSGDALRGGVQRTYPTTHAANCSLGVKTYSEVASETGQRRSPPWQRN